MTLKNGPEAPSQPATLQSAEPYEYRGKLPAVCAAGTKQEPRLGERCAEQLDTDGQAVRREAGRNAQRRQAGGSAQLARAARLRVADPCRLASHGRVDDGIEPARPGALPGDGVKMIEHDEVEVRACLDAGVVTNRNSVPADPNGAWYTSGIRFGTPALTSRGVGHDEFDRVAELVVDVLANTTPRLTKDGKQSKANYTLADGVAERTKAASAEMLDKYPLYPGLEL